MAKEGEVMEHRDSHRTRASMKLLLYKANIPIVVAVTRDISAAGIFVLTNFIDIDPSQPLGFELLHDRPHFATRKRYRTLLVEKRSDGLALKFEEAQKRDASKLAAMVAWAATLYPANSSPKPRREFISDLASEQNAIDGGEFYGADIIDSR